MPAAEETTETTVTPVDVQATPTKPNGKNNDDPVTAPSSEASPTSPQAVAFKNQQGHYAYQNHTIPNSPSQGNGGYDIQSLLAQQVPTTSTFGRQYGLVPPLSPAMRDNNSNGEHALPPASPLFPGTAVPLYNTNSEQHDSNVVNQPSMFASTASPSFQYLSGPPPSPVISYGYSPSIPNSPEARSSWTDRGLPQQQQHLYNTAPAASPHLHVPVQYPGNNTTSRRTTSFDGEMLPPAAIVDDNSSVMFSTGSTLVSQQSWTPAHEVYSTPSLQHLTQQVASPPRTNGLPGREQHIPEYLVNPYYPVAATPGPPIQTTQNNKGPDGANLFIFHIPNHFTNLDMWHLFCHYGNLLSVRIMVEKDTGRSRGFGFVSYDSPDAAAMAIKELNGFVIGNKRLKVQHKQIRQSDNNQVQQHEGSSQKIMSPSSGANPHWQGAEPNIEKSQPSANLDATKQESKNNENIESSLNNLEGIKDALPDVNN